MVKKNKDKANNGSFAKGVAIMFVILIYIVIFLKIVLLK